MIQASLSNDSFYRQAEGIPEKRVKKKKKKVTQTPSQYSAKGEVIN
jgi:hypothetical protein